MEKTCAAEKNRTTSVYVGRKKGEVLRTEKSPSYDVLRRDG